MYSSACSLLIVDHNKHNLKYKNNPTLVLYQYHKLMFNFIDIYIFIPVSGCVTMVLSS
jgi:hypothetical protein